MTSTTKYATMNQGTKTDSLMKWSQIKEKKPRIIKVMSK